MTPISDSESYTGSHGHCGPQTRSSRALRPGLPVSHCRALHCDIESRSRSRRRSLTAAGQWPRQARPGLRFRVPALAAVRVRYVGYGPASAGSHESWWKNRVPACTGRGSLGVMARVDSDSTGLGPGRAAATAVARGKPGWASESVRVRRARAPAAAAAPGPGAGGTEPDLSLVGTVTVPAASRTVSESQT